MAVGEIQVRKTIYFDNFGANGWPAPNELQRFFVAPKGQEWSFEGRNDSWGLDVRGLLGTADRAEIDQVKVHLYMIGNRDLAVYLIYVKGDGRTGRAYVYDAKRDLSRRGEF